ncbi:hypothetical protein Tsubulata_017738 [Turnera subulata]|uniref:Chaperone DnaJ C-terminal domain-containing protein n=1 Tax=Turnera subulata TaxID=218843 RepID=A0A9Q0JPS6_9ROSI|nr:hypothetical protein Tsubulata_017738 [Turnera subulata]
MWVSSIKSLCCRRCVKDVNLVRFYNVSALAVLSPNLSNPVEEITVNTPPEGDFVGDNRFLELNSVRAVEALNSLRKDPVLAFSLFNQLKEGGFSHDVYSYAAVVKILCVWGLNRKLDSVLLEIIRKKKDLDFEIPELLQVLEEGPETGCSDLLVRVSSALVKAYVSVGMFHEAIDVFFWAKPDICSCNFLMNRLIECQKEDMAVANRLIQFTKVDTAVAIYHQLKSIGLSPNEFTYTLAIKALCVKGSLQEALDVFREMAERSVTPSAFAYSTFIEGLCMHGQSDEGFRVLQACVAEKVPVDAFAYAAVIRGFCKEMKLKEAELVLADMERHGFPPDLYAYSALIQGFCKGRYIIEALHLHEEMTSKGIRTNCKILSLILQGLSEMDLNAEAANLFKEKFEGMGIFFDETCYNIVLNALCKVGRVEEAAAMFIEMKTKQVIPDLINYTTLIGGYCLKGKLKDAWKLFEEMKKNGYNPDIVAYNVLIGGFSRHGKTQKALFLLKDMEAQGIKPNHVTHNMIIEGLCIEGREKDAKEYFCNLEEKCSENLSAMISGLCQANKTKKAFQLFVRLSEQGVLVTKASLLKLLHNLFVEADHKTAFQLLQKMPSDAVPPKIMYRKVIGMLCRAEKMKKAERVFKDMVGSGLTPDLMIYTMMINGYCRLNCLREAFLLLDDMVKRGIKPDVITYTVLIDGSAKQYQSVSYAEQIDTGRQKKIDSVASNTKNAIGLFNQMKDKGIQPDVICYTALIDHHCKASNIEDAVELFNEMVDGGLQPDTKTYTALLSGHCKVGDIAKAEVLYEEMLDKGIGLDACTKSVLRRHCILKARKVQFRLSGTHYPASLMPPVFMPYHAMEEKRFSGLHKEKAMDIRFVLQLKVHPKFMLKGDDIFVDHTLSLTEALCGLQLCITHFDGRSQPGQVVKPDQFAAINGGGMPIYQEVFMEELYIHFQSTPLIPFPGQSSGDCSSRTSIQLTDMELDECEEATLQFAGPRLLATNN